jgi:Icc-related predicted phosphoesterase
MKIQLVSDSHIEFHRDGGRDFVSKLGAAGVDVLVLAGDICGCSAIEEVVSGFCDRYPEVVYVIGNHELYGSGFVELRDSLARADSRSSNLHVLDNSVAEIGGRRFVGTTLWFPFHADNERHEMALNDFRQIADFKGQVYGEHERAADFLFGNVCAGDIVVTHHLPSMRSVPPRYVRDPLNRFFVAPMDELIVDAQPLLWLHGHTHESVDYVAGATRVLANPFGYYPFAVNLCFDENMVIDLDRE